jgi:Ser/Thr protein kinase RdoA (MazF antagonist)
VTGFSELSPDQQAARLRDAGKAALRQWGIVDAELELIKYRENAVFRVRHHGQLAALRVHRRGYHIDSELRSELQWMRALASSGIQVPIAIPTVSGELFVSYEAPELPGPVQMDLFEWISGEQLGSVEQGVADAAAVAGVYRTIGELAARVHNQSSAWTVPAGFVRHSWDAEGLAGDKPFWGRFWELQAASRSQRDLLTRGRDRVYRDLARLDKSPETYSMIHADFCPENLLVEGDRVRLIDFDDAGFGWHMFELATALYFLIGGPTYMDARNALIEGYRAHRKLPDELLRDLELFLLARAFTYVGWVHTRPETETARELTPMLLDSACALAEDYLSA